ncbi:hypothetical protein MNBD_GAMMA09-792 [hydrothermal vent metagenome]|uniref:Uncharacterized protein n=1 Tax=hydrothermal vent metagenome TaxID=652676 RepID=A0A3B0XL33_9ZZZZ
MTLKQRFLDAVCNGDLGEEDEHGVTVQLTDFKRYFSDIRSDYINSFLPAAVIETGQYSITHTKYLYRAAKGVYRVHPDAVEQHRAEANENINGHRVDNKIEEIYGLYQCTY